MKKKLRAIDEPDLALAPTLEQLYQRVNSRQALADLIQCAIHSSDKDMHGNPRGVPPLFAVDDFGEASLDQI